MTARLISSATLWHLHVTQGRSEDLCAWVRANGIDPDLVPIEHDLTIADTPDGPVIRYRAYVTEEGGTKLVDPNRSGQPLMEEHTTPLVVEPPNDWPVYMQPGPA
ncbi:hypothetical protein ACIQ6R_16175 [Streptomyces sp. NPDC096048]|uniref:hypothetical protein n=1 Tax=Streptomyces sp. NPDC096048 TaxID=3366072 RepID=UPI00382CDFC9